jgi:hypothetical protein
MIFHPCSIRSLSVYHLARDYPYFAHITFALTFTSGHAISETSTKDLEKTYIAQRHLRDLHVGAR